MPNTPDNPNLSIENRFNSIEQRVQELQTQSAYVVSNSAGAATVVLGNLAPVTGIKAFGLAVWSVTQKEWVRIEGETGTSGAWTAIEALSAKIESHTVEVRKEGGATVARLKGKIVTKEEIPANTALFTLPVGFRPLVASNFAFFSEATGAANVQISTAGVVTLSRAIVAKGAALFDGITLPLT